MKIKKIYEPILQSEVFLIFDCKYDDLEKWLDKRAIRKESYKLLVGAVTDYEDEKNAIHYVIWIEDKKDFYTLFHENVHLVKRLFTDRKVPFNGNNDEMVAYYLTFWFKKLWRLMNK
jgi:hypothetical protein